MGGGNPLTPTDKMMVQLAGLLQRFSAQTHSAQRIDVTSIGIESCTRSLYVFAPSLILLVAPCGVGRVLFQRVQPGRPYIMSPVVSQQTKKLHRLAPHIHGKTRRGSQVQICAWSLFENGIRRKLHDIIFGV